jgi:hypothetical protein
MLIMIFLVSISNQFIPTAISETQTEFISLFTESNQESTTENPVITALYKNIIRWRPVNINPKMFEDENIRSQTEILLNLFDDTIFTTFIDNVNTNIIETKSITGTIKNAEYATFCMTTTNDVSYITIQMPQSDQLFIVQYIPESSSYYLMELQLSTFKEREDSNALLIPDENQTIFFNNEESFETITIDIMMLYTPAAKNWANNNGVGIENVISQALAKCQNTLSNSDTNVIFNLAYAAEINYTESGSSTTDINRLRNTNDGYMDEIHNWRTTYGADLVQLFEYVNDVGGLAWQLNNPMGSPQYGFSLVRVQQASTGYSCIHEFGHNMGCDHHKQQTSYPGPGLFDYSAGWRWTGNDQSRYCSVMTYESGQYFPDGQNHIRVAHFSNPQIYHEGIATGDITDGDNARTIREINQVIAAYEQSPAQIDINQSVYDHGFPVRHTSYGDWGGAQSFTPNFGTLTQVKLYLRTYGIPEFDLAVELRQQGVDGSLIDSKIYTPSEIPDEWTWFTIDFNDILIDPNIEYFIVCQPAPAGITNNFGYEWGYAFGNQYDNGVFWFTRDSGDLWRDLPTMYEFNFITYGY